METKGGTGEAGVYIRNKENYHTEIKAGSLEKLAEPVCQKYGVVVPDFIVRPQARRRWGYCYYGKNLISLNLPIKLGVFYHELAHHINYYKKHGVGHTQQFKQILNDIFQMYNV